MNRRSFLIFVLVSLVSTIAYNCKSFATDDVAFLISCVKDVGEKQTAKTPSEIAGASAAYSASITFALESVKDTHREQEAVQALIKLINEKRRLVDSADALIVCGALSTLDRLGEFSRKALPVIESLKNHTNPKIAEKAEAVYSSIEEGTFDNNFRMMEKTLNRSE